MKTIVSCRATQSITHGIWTFALCYLLNSLQRHISPVCHVRHVIPGNICPSLSWWQVVSELHRAPGDVVELSQASWSDSLLQLLMANSRHTNKNIQHVLTEHHGAKCAQARRGEDKLHSVSLQICRLRRVWITVIITDWTILNFSIFTEIFQWGKICGR